MEGQLDVLVFAVMAFLISMFVVLVVRDVLGDETLIRQLINEYMEDPATSEVYLEAKRACAISVVYLCENEPYVIREQLTCLAHVISSTFTNGVNAEFLCFITDEWKMIVPQMERLAQSLQCVRLFRVRENNPIVLFALGSMYARGRIIVDARHLCSEIDCISKNLQTQFVRFVHEPGLHESTTIPISGDKKSLMKIFRSLHLMGPGAFYEMNLLACVNSVHTEVVQRGGIDRTVFGVMYVLKSLVWRWVMQQMYANRMWSISVDFIC